MSQLPVVSWKMIRWQFCKNVDGGHDWVRGRFHSSSSFLNQEAMELPVPGRYTAHYGKICKSSTSSQGSEAPPQEVWAPVLPVIPRLLHVQSSAHGAILIMSTKVPKVLLDYDPFHSRVASQALPK